MKIINTSQVSATKGMPLKSGSIEHLLSSIKEIAEALYQVGVQSYDNTKVNILFGCDNSGSGSTYTISAGAVLYNGEVFLVPAASFTAGTGAVAVLDITNYTATNADPVTFTDGTPYNVHEIRKINIVDGDSSAAGYIADYADFVNPVFRGNNMLEEDSVSGTANISGVILSTFTPSSSLSGDCMVIFDGQVHPASGGGGTTYVVTVSLQVNGSVIVSKGITVANDGSYHDINIAKKITYNAGDVVAISAICSTSALADVAGRTIIQGTKMS